MPFGFDIFFKTIERAAHIDGFHLGITGANAAHHLEPVHRWHLNIRDHELCRMIEVFRIALEAVKSRENFIATDTQQKAQRVGNILVIIYDKYAMRI